jgi:phenylacetate-CoA ligase
MCADIAFPPAEDSLIHWPQLSRGEKGGFRLPMDALEKTEKLNAQEREAQQYAQLCHLAHFAQAHTPHFRARMEQAGLIPQDLGSQKALQLLPRLSRRDLQLNLSSIDSGVAAQPHAPFNTLSTSGSTGEPISLRRSAACQAFWMAYTLREHLWHRRNFSLPLAVIRGHVGGAKPMQLPNWGAPVSMFFATGAGHALAINTDTAQQAAWLSQVRPGYVLLYPNTLAALLDEAEAGRLNLRQLQQLRTIGETLQPALRARAREVLGVEVADTYSSQEAGIIAYQCPEAGTYHVMEGLIVELLDEDGNPVPNGEVGRVVLTDLHNFATPLIRYEIGDYAIRISTPCACGRGLDGLLAIKGRERNLVKLPDGRRHWPLVGFHRYRAIADIAQYQVVQHSLEQVELRLVVGNNHPLSAHQEQQLQALLRESLGHDFDVHITYFTGQIPRGVNGKFDEFMCLI